MPSSSPLSTSSLGERANTPRRSETPNSNSSHTTHNGGGGGSSGMHSGPPGGGASGGGAGQSTRRSTVTYCAKCGQVVRGQFVRALHQVYHLDCFRCKDCDMVVAQKFFPVEDSEGQYPLCERDYFARLDLICAKCDQALRSSYITACGKKFHVEHFSCSVCEVVFGANDSYYEHGGKVYCHYHYSISFANKCVGCETAILKQFVEINRNGRDECWHPECYMIHKFWNVRLASRNFATPATTTPTTSTLTLMEMTALSASSTSVASSQPNSVPSASTSPGWGTELTADELKDRQVAMELKVSQIWLVLSGFEESSAACIGEMLRVVNERQLLEVILLAEKFILHVETLFAVIDDLEAQFALAGVKGMSHAREAKQLCRKLVNFFSMLSQISPHGGPIPHMQDLLTQVTQLAHYLKILIRIALTGAIKLDREQSNPHAMTNALACLHLLSLDNADPTLHRRGDHPPQEHSDPSSVADTAEEIAKRSFESLSRNPVGFLPSTQSIAYGYRSLAAEVTGETTLRGPQDDHFVPNDGCARCNGTIEDDCVRLGMFNRWHSACVVCQSCGDRASVTKDIENGSVNASSAPRPITSAVTDEDSHEGSAHQQEGSSSSIRLVTRRIPPRVNDFSYEPPLVKFAKAETIFCNLHRSFSAIDGFQSVSRLEQFAFLLHVALRRLYLHFREHHGIPSAATHAAQDVKRVKSVTLDRKLSSTARVPQRSTVVESPAGRMADENGQVIPAPRPQLSMLLVPTTNVVGPSSGSSGGHDYDNRLSSTVDVIRPPFARNNTSIRIVSEAQTPNSPRERSPGGDMLSPLAPPPPRRVQEDDAITLGDIPTLANQSMIRVRSPLDGLPLMAQLSPLQSLIVRHFALLQLQKSGIGHLIDLDDVLELVDVRKNQWWNKLFKNNAKKDQKKKGVFGVPLEILVERTGSDSQQGASSGAQLRVPEFIEDIVSTMRQMDMAVEGIFRKNGNIRRLQTIAEAIDKDSTSVTLSEENPVQLAALLKRFLREMPDPLLTFRLHKLYCAAASLSNNDDRKRCLHLLSILLPKANRDTMEVLFVFLRWVASFSYRDEETGSRMDLANLATVICPSILYAKGANAARDESLIGIQAVQQLLEDQDEFYRVPHELLFVIQENVSSIFAKEIDLPPKEIHKHCAKYLHARTAAQHQRPPLPPSSSSGGGGNGSVPPPPGAGQMRERQTDSRLSAYRSDGNLSASADYGSNSPFRPIGATSSGSRPSSWVGGPGGMGTPSASSSALSAASNSTAPGTGGSGGGQGQHGLPVSMQNLQLNSAGPGGPGINSNWRGGGVGGGPFQGSASGSRNSSRGSAPPSPVPDAERRSFQMERDISRERTWTPTLPER